MLQNLSVAKASPVRVAIALGLLLITQIGCTSTSRRTAWGRRPNPVLEHTATKEQIVSRVNFNQVKTETHPVMSSWRSGSVRVHVDGVPIALPATIAVQAPSNFRLLVSNPLSGGQEVDIGSNSERCWMWSKDQPQVMTASHDDIGMAMQQLQMPIHIHPLWLMEVLGVVPLKPEEFEVRRGAPDATTVDLIATRESPLGEDVERIVRVNLIQGCVQEHILRMPGGKVLAKARLDKYTVLPNGTELPLLVKLEWPDAQMQMTMEIRDPEINSPSLVNSATVWKMPEHGPVVDIGELAKRQQKGASYSATAKASPAKSAVTAAPGKVTLTSSETTISETEQDWATPKTAAKSPQAERPSGLAEVTAAPPAGDIPAWAKP